MAGGGHSADYAERYAEAQKVVAYEIGGREYPRIPYGQERRGGLAWHLDASGRPHPCGDCAVQPGEYHLPGCDVEECPRCGRQSTSCDCDGEE